MREYKIIRQGGCRKEDKPTAREEEAGGTRLK